MTDIFVAPKQDKSGTLFSQNIFSREGNNGPALKAKEKNFKKILDKKQTVKNSSLYEEPHMNILSSFSQYPKNVSFHTQKENEQIILFLRSRFITNISWMTFTIFLIFLPAIITFLLPLFQINFLSSDIVTHFTTIYVIFYYLIVFSYILINFLTWFYNIFIVTADRIVDINYLDIVVHNVSETKLKQIEDVRYSQSGFIPTLFNYGNLFVQTAGTEENFEANCIPKPKEATDIIAGILGENG